VAVHDPQQMRDKASASASPGVSGRLPSLGRRCRESSGVGVWSKAQRTLANRAKVQPVRGRKAPRWLRPYPCYAQGWQGPHTPVSVIASGGSAPGNVSPVPVRRCRPARHAAAMGTHTASRRAVPHVRSLEDERLAALDAVEGWHWQHRPAFHPSIVASRPTTTLVGAGDGLLAAIPQIDDNAPTATGAPHRRCHYGLAPRCPQ
jgi:hypothetical protein